MVKPSLLIAQVTDTHLFADPTQQMMGCLTASTLAAVLAHLRQLQPKPDILLLTGDLSHDETPESYQRLQDQLVPLDIPAYWLPGNHDSLPAMEQVLRQPPISPAKFFAAGGWRFLLLNSLVPGCVHGELSSTSLEWLEQQLQLSDRPTLISLHHPPCPIHSRWMDAINLQSPEKLFAVIDRYPQVKLVVFGHIHQAFEEQRRDVHYLGSPSTCVQFKPGGQEFAIDPIQPGFRLLALFPDGSFQTKVVRVDYKDALPIA